MFKKSIFYGFRWHEYGVITVNIGDKTGIKDLRNSSASRYDLKDFLNLKKILSWLV